jgi:hypothetical protein
MTVDACGDASLGRSGVSSTVEFDVESEPSDIEPVCWHAAR